MKSTMRTNILIFILILSSVITAGCITTTQQMPSGTRPSLTKRSKATMAQSLEFPWTILHPTLERNKAIYQGMIVVLSVLILIILFRHRRMQH